jgi:hypothetical protein
MLEALADTMMHPGMTAYQYRSIQGKINFSYRLPSHCIPCMGGCPTGHPIDLNNSYFRHSISTDILFNGNS